MMLKASKNIGALIFFFSHIERAEEQDRKKREGSERKNKVILKINILIV
jgi:hypothetical protein